MGNPAVWWVGAAAMIFVIVRLLSMKGDRNYLYIVLGFAAQYLPWVLVPRSMFIYHYFASVPFIILATVMVYRWMEEKEWGWRKPAMIAVLAAALILFVAFYPLMSGTPVARSFANYLRWFNRFLPASLTVGRNCSPIISTILTMVCLSPSAPVPCIWAWKTSIRSVPLVKPVICGKQRL